MTQHIKSSQTTWDEAVEILKADQIFSQLPVKEIRKLFSEFKDKKLQEEKLSEIGQMESKKRSLEEFLVEDKRMHSKIKYEEANELFQSEKVWTAVNDELIRRKLFEKALPTILGREVKLMKVKREQNIENLKKLFKSNKMIMYDTTWAEAQQLLLEDESFENDENLQNMDKEDALSVFQDYQKELDAKHGEEMKYIAKCKEIAHAKYRKNFLSLLKKLYRDKILTESSLWKDILPKIKDNSAFLNMLCLQNSTTPLDMFKFFIFDLKTNYATDLAIIKDILRNTEFKITLKANYDTFYNLIRSHRAGLQVHRQNLIFYYDNEISNLKHEKLAEAGTTPYDQKCNDFKRLLQTQGKNLIPHQNFSYSDLVSKINNYPEFANLPDETEKHRIFRKVRHHLYSVVQQQSQATSENLQQKANEPAGVNQHSATEDSPTTETGELKAKYCVSETSDSSL